CHAAQVDSWSGTHHALANRPPSAREDLPTFSPPGQVRAGGASYGMTEHGGTFTIRAREADGSEQEYPLVGVIGHTPVRQYLASLPGNPLQPTSAIRDIANDRWLDVFAGHGRRPRDRRHRTGTRLNRDGRR